MARQMRRGARVQHTWLALSDTWSLSGITATTATALMTFESQAAGTFNQMPVEDIIVDRVVGEVNVALTAAASANWTLGVLVADATWDPSSTFVSDADKRVLWHETFQGILQSGALPTYSWSYGQLRVESGAGTTVNGGLTWTDKTRVDFTPRVRLSPGKSLFLVAWENSGAETFSTSTTDMRLLFHRARR